jgi:hypothetical protein
LIRRRFPPQIASTAWAGLRCRCISQF